MMNDDGGDDATIHIDGDDMVGTYGMVFCM
jgi:hypothetical protein